MKTKAFEIVVKTAFFLCLLMPGTAGATGYTLTVSAQGSGTVTKNPTNATYPPGVNVIVTATPDTGWYFANWSGDTNGTINPLNVTMNSSLVITGNFLAYPTYTLTLVTNGQGAIDLSPAGGSYLSNTIVTATATAATGWVFMDWSGGTNSSANPVSLTLNTNLSLTGTFAQLPAFDIQPLSVTNVVGSTVSFSAHAVGNAPLGYQWFFSGGSLISATNTTLSLTNVPSGKAGNYWIIATNSYGSATSHVASLTLTNAGGSTNVVISPTEASLRAAIKIGGWVSLAFNGTVTITNTISITNNVILDGTGVSATISGGNAVRLFYVAPGVTFCATNLTLANGSCLVTSGMPGTPADAGAIYNDGGAVTLVACTLTNNSAQSLIYGGLARGGAIFNNAGTVSLCQSAISNNAAIAGGQNGNGVLAKTDIGLGGAIYNTNGSVTIAGCNVSGNFCEGMCNYNYGITGLAMGGAAFQASGSLTVSNSIFSFNSALGGSAGSGSILLGSPAYGGALAVTVGSVVMDHSQFAGNTAQGGYGALVYGGAVYCTANLTAGYTAFHGNQGASSWGNSSPSGYGGAIYNSGSIELNQCSVYSNSIQGSWGNNSHFFNPQKGGDGLGGGIYNASQLAATNCTIALNSAINGSGSAALGGAGTLGMNGNALGGGIFNAANATFTAMNVTIASNSCVQGTYPYGGSIPGLAAGTQIANATNGNGTLSLHNCLIAGANSNAYGTITDVGYNICSDGSANLNSGSSYSFTNPRLGPLANYGGPTLCLALLSNSPAIDFGDSSGAPATDQRGFIRPFGDGVDIGTYEYGSCPSVIPYLNITSTTSNVWLSFAAFPPSLYRLQVSTNLSTWTDLNTNGPFACSTNISQTISKQGFNRRYFRVLAQ